MSARAWTGTGALKTLGSGGIALLGAIVLFTTWPSSHRSTSRLPTGPWTVPVTARWIPLDPTHDDALHGPDPLETVDFDENRDLGHGIDDDSSDPEPPAPSSRPYSVRKNDGLWRIAERELGSAARISEIESLNPGITTRVLHPGDRIWLPDTAGSSPRSRESAAWLRHQVRRGETLSEIGARFRVPAARIFEWNRDQLRSPDEVREGSILRILADERERG